MRIHSGASTIAIRSNHAQSGFRSHRGRRQYIFERGSYIDDVVECRLLPCEAKRGLGRAGGSSSLVRRMSPAKSPETGRGAAMEGSCTSECLSSSSGGAGDFGRPRSDPVGVGVRETWDTCGVW